MMHTRRPYMMGSRVDSAPSTGGFQRRHRGSASSCKRRERRANHNGRAIEQSGEQEETFINAFIAFRLLKRAVTRREGPKLFPNCFLLTESNKSDVAMHTIGTRDRAHPRKTKKRIACVDIVPIYVRVLKRIGCLCARRRTLEVTHVSIITQSSAKPTRTNTSTAKAARVLRVRECNEMMQQKHFRTMRRHAS
mmetsp:Transcript_8179/g.27107  ORF Transcript_8179/g.27107 Transcript_8179/m.27107 type:complete len:193 (+) Transcript_8179:1682-2260(+)